MPSKTLNIDIWGVINPNRVNNIKTDYFGLGLLSNNSVDENYIIEGSFTIDGIIPLLAPGLFLKI